MIETATTLSSEQARELAAAVWGHVEQSRPGPVAAAPAVERLVRAVDGGRAGRLEAFVERVDALEPEQRRRFVAAIDDVQVRSKLWLLDEVARVRELGGTTMVVLGGWYGILPLLCHWTLPTPPARMLCVDIDAAACELGRRVVGAVHADVEFRVGDAMDLDYTRVSDGAPADVVVNTICEHLADAPGWWGQVPPGQLVALQSNDYDRCPDHVNCVADLAEMEAQTPLAETAFRGTLRLPIFDRFMLIGRR